jgi:uncharacterized Zn finger protein
MRNEDEKTINSRPATAFAAGAAMDADARNKAAYDQFQEVYDDPDFATRVETVQKIVDDFFRVKDMYTNYRANRGKPMVVVKVTNQIFPNVSSKIKQETYRGPLENLGVEIVFSKGTNSYLYRIRP